MSTAKSQSTMEDTFASKLGIEMVTKRVFQSMIELCAGTTNVVCAVGPSGIGKTAIPRQVARLRNKGKGVPYYPLFMPTATQEGFFIPTTAPDTKRYFDQRIPRGFEKVIDWAEAMEKKYKGKVPKDMCPILSIEELNRAVDKSVTRAAFVLIGDRMIGDIPLPACLQIVATMNPTGGGMSVNEFEKDPAMRRRLSPMIGVGYSYGDFMLHATEAAFHPDVLGHLGAQPSHGYDAQAATAGKHFACPATWERVSEFCYMFQESEQSLDSAIGRAAVAGAIGVAAATAFLDYVRDHSMTVTPEDVLLRYGVGTETRRRFKTFLPSEGEGRMDKVADLTRGLTVYLFAKRDNNAKAIADKLALYISDLPLEVLASFMKQLNDQATTQGPDARKYLQNLNQELSKIPAFSESLNRLLAAKQAGIHEEKHASAAACP
jgi:hypothetical protein